MKHKPRKKLLQFEKFYPIFFALAFITVFGITGVDFILHSDAASATGSPIKSGISGDCLDDYQDSSTSGNKVDIFSCNQSKAQDWITNTSGNIEINNLCIGLSGGATTAGTKTILAPCTATARQVWYEQSNGYLQNFGANKYCLTASSSVNNTQLQIDPCTSKAVTSQIWHGGPVQPAPPPTPTPTPPPTPSPPTPTPNPPTPTPKPKPKPTPRPSPTPLPILTTSPTPEQTITPTEPSPTPTVSIEQQQPTNPNRPSISDVQVTNITTNSITIVWLANDVSGYTIKYGLSAQDLNNVFALRSSKNTASFSFNHLPSDKNIFIEIIPKHNGTSGTAVKGEFKTDAGHSVIGVILVIFFIILIIIFFGFVLLRLKRNQKQSEDVDIANIPAFPQEDSESYASRLLWWVPDDERQQIVRDSLDTKPKKKTDEMPDMYEEGRKRLDDEEKDHLIPKK